MRSVTVKKKLSGEVREGWIENVKSREGRAVSTIMHLSLCHELCEICPDYINLKINTYKANSKSCETYET